MARFDARARTTAHRTPTNGKNVGPASGQVLSVQFLAVAASTQAGSTREVTERKTRKSSASGYAAIRYGKWVGAHLALALSPQYSVRRRRLPFERRWRHQASAIQFLHEHAQGVVRRAIIVYDPLDKDAQHVRLFRKITDVEVVVLPGNGHPCIHFLHYLGVLQAPYWMSAMSGSTPACSLATQ